MTDAVEALRKNVEQEAADEFIGAQCHGALAIGAIAAIILVAERDTMFVERDQPTVRDGDAVGISRQKASGNRGAQRNDANRSPVLH